MPKLSEFDKKLLYELGKNARQSYKQIAQRVRSRKETVAYHITQLVKDGIITKFVPVVSFTKLGVYSFKIYIKLRGLTEEAEKELYNSLISNKDVNWVAKAVGEWDLLLAFYSLDIISFAQKKNGILSKFSQYIAGYDITMIEDALVFNRDYLIGKKEALRKEFVFSGAQKISLKEDEKELLKLVKDNGRFHVVDVAEKLGQDPRTIISKIKNLEKMGVMQGYTIFVDLKKLGYQLHKLCIYLGNYQDIEVNKLISFIKGNPNVIHIIKSIGSWDIEAEIEADNLDLIYNYIKQLKNNFPDLIKRIDIATIVDEPKLEFFPESI